MNRRHGVSNGPMTVVEFLPSRKGQQDIGGENNVAADLGLTRRAAS